MLVVEKVMTRFYGVPQIKKYVPTMANMVCCKKKKKAIRVVLRNHTCFRGKSNCREELLLRNFLFSLRRLVWSTNTETCFRYIANHSVRSTPPFSLLSQHDRLPSLFLCVCSFPAWRPSRITGAPSEQRPLKPSFKRTLSSIFTC